MQMLNENQNSKVTLKSMLKWFFFQINVHFSLAEGWTVLARMDFRSSF